MKGQMEGMEENIKFLEAQLEAEREGRDDEPLSPGGAGGRCMWGFGRTGRVCQGVVGTFACVRDCFGYVLCI